MGGKPKPARAPSGAVRFARVLLRPQNRGPVLALVVAIGAIVGLVAAWNRWGEPSTKSGDYVVTAEKIALTPPPDWVHADVKAEVVRAASLSQLDLRDRKLVEQVAQAFAMHAWIAKVERVEKQFPARVKVDVVWRRPVAAVEIVTAGKPGLLFVDEQGVLLSSADFAENQAQNFLRIAGGERTPAGGYGQPWGDEQIVGAARIAAVWGERFKEAGLYRIVGAKASGGSIMYELLTAGGVRIVWGSAPGSEASSEAGAEQKIQTLLDHIADKGPLDRTGGESVIELSKLVAPRTATTDTNKAPR